MIERGDELVTVFGGGGFIGRYVCELLLKNGVRVRVASRRPRSAHFIQPLGEVGQIGFVRADITDSRSVARAVDGASAVVNLCGILKGHFHDVHVTGAANASEAARDAGARALVQISAIGADPMSEADYGKTKAEGEAAVRAAFPTATIIRPSLVFGPEDQITNRLAAFARLPFLPVIAAQRRFQPVYVLDLASAIAKAALEPERYGGKVYEIGGPQVMSMRELHAAIVESTGRTPELVDMPNFMAALLSWFGWFPGAPLTRDQWRMLQRDNVASEGAPGLEAFGIEPTPLGAVAHEWLGRFNKGGRFAGRRINLTATS
ncbi:complex I NDUFA9 subunit family protein [Sphingomonas sp.]|uniref:complex I NDUFA9 subunit family protein n=1 Tax=Sphingomonas sp. TaxID=28214 RepID=UPI0017F54305|nr:complex I NDUFA9 subunit family protein [Sphingomonas sp.]MBA3512247.1 complex I NDUFA9 subunit family protein [Sphingomonas sp.]